MLIFCSIVIGIFGFIIFFAMIGYPVLLIVLDKLFKPRENKKDTEYEPTVSYMIVAHNEEKVIRKKLENTLKLSYPREKLEIIIASDNSTDRTDEIVEDFIKEHPEQKIVLHKTKEHKGKTNAQNEAQKKVSGEILVMTDANSMLEGNAIKELVSSFSEEKIVYVCGKLVYSNMDKADSSTSEATYWNLDLRMRNIESKFQTITAGNGAIYACRNAEYIDFEPIFCHDSAMPFAYALQGKRAIFNPNAVAKEKAGENNKDELKRKIRMNRNILYSLYAGIKTLNVFKYRWFSLFYFGHRICRYSLWLAHILIFIASLIMIAYCPWLGALMTLAQLFVVMLTACTIKRGISRKYLRLIGYYGMTVFAQMMGVYNILTGKAKPVWEKAESTR